ncbi:hypothetical protein L1049_025919 [Liquidambar formosana]|uniref:tRNA pseudouridine(55) synthase n=1 Tax=Liquidambar formosana TaxID=63359 RepID=A0AAP0NC64_LIQFO
MPDETEAPQVLNDQEEAHISSDAGDDEKQVFSDAVRQLPPHAVKDLLSVGVCTRCILRLFGIRGKIYPSSSLSPSILCAVLGEPTNADKHMVENGVQTNEGSGSHHASKELDVEPVFCSICLGILQFIYRDDKGMLVKKNSANNLAASIAELVKREGHHIDNFSLEVSIPPIVLENEHAVWLYMKRKYGSECWFGEKFHSDHISAKDALKNSIASPIETLLDVQSGLSSFRIRLTYSHTKASKMIQNFIQGIEGCKRRKQGTDDVFNTVDGSVVAGVECPDFSSSEADAVIQGSFNALQDHEYSERFKFPPEKVNEPCCLTSLCYRTPIYFGGRYLKYSRNVSQTRWIIDDERMGEASVEEILGSNILSMCQGDNYKFHAAGREDIDVRMLGSGRPFLVEIQNARHVPSEAFIKEIEVKINNLENKLVRVKNLKVVGSQGWTLMREGEAEKQKQYTALVWISRQLEDADMQTVSSLKEMRILQRTPIRVLHRRSPLEREKIIHWMKIERIAGSSQYFLLHLCTQAGTYIKEFVHGDLGRTHPSIGSILGCRVEILQLDVTDVKMDCFLTE